jgi:hypothetical protein
MGRSMSRMIVIRAKQRHVSKKEAVGPSGPTA